MGVNIEKMEGEKHKLLFTCDRCDKELRVLWSFYIDGIADNNWSRGQAFTHLYYFCPTCTQKNKDDGEKWINNRFHFSEGKTWEK